MAFLNFGLRKHNFFKFKYTPMGNENTGGRNGKKENDNYPFQRGL